ncbi:hypothetical protein J2X66_005625 [Pseudomonas sp. 3296]|uniref:hypothetical protein n=1 Tax=Pseudomonas sp. 3296 TaxID=2817753 RepID=UPI0028625681|nr:hypothetical protein [Pseudomonas sp. 3296]MDR6918722.1 hypothetical protein [Pseudomonas sp. 3296]
MNYLVTHKPSQLILKVITTAHTPIPDRDHTFHPASVAVLDKFYKLATKARRKGVLVNVGDLANVSPSFLQSLLDSKNQH